jgi:hypothetical protein
MVVRVVRNDSLALLLWPHVCRLLEWQQQKVWCNSRPEEAAYPVTLQYAQPDGRLKSLASADALRSAAEQQVLAGRSLLWLAAARDSALQEAARLMGAANFNVAASGHAATAAARSEGAVLVRAKESDSVPAAYRKRPWTTRNLLLVRLSRFHQIVQPLLCMC